MGASAICNFLVRENAVLMTELSFAIVKWSYLINSSKTQAVSVVTPKSQSYKTKKVVFEHFIVYLKSV